MKKVFVLFAALALMVACKGGNDSPTGTELTAITLSEHSITVEKGGFQVLEVKFTPQNASDKTVTWVSTSPSVATVSDGIVAGVAPGKTEIVAKAGNLVDRCQVTVVDPSSPGSSDDPSGEESEDPGEELSTDPGEGESDDPGEGESDDPSTDPSAESEDPSGEIDWDSMGHEGTGHNVNVGGGSRTGNISGTNYQYDLYNYEGTAVFTWYSNGTYKAQWTNSSDVEIKVGYSCNDDPATTNFVLDYKCTKEGHARGIIGAAAWTTDPLIEIWIADDWFAPLSSDELGTYVGEYTLDDETYKLYALLRQNAPSIQGYANFYKYTAVRNTPRTFGTIHISEHFKIMNEMTAKAGKQKLGTLYDVMAASIAYGSSITGSIDYTYFNMTK